MAVAGLVLGIVSLIMALAGIGVWFLPFAGLVLSIIGLVLSCVARKKAKSGVATAGLVVGIISVILNGIFGVTCGICVGIIGAAGCAAAQNAAEILLYLI